MISRLTSRRSGLALTSSVAGLSSLLYPSNLDWNDLKWSWVDLVRIFVVCVLVNLRHRTRNIAPHRIFVGLCVGRDENQAHPGLFNTLGWAGLELAGEAVFFHRYVKLPPSEVFNCWSLWCHLEKGHLSAKKQQHVNLFKWCLIFQWLPSNRNPFACLCTSRVRIVRRLIALIWRLPAKLELGTPTIF